MVQKLGSSRGVWVKENESLCEGAVRNGQKMGEKMRDAGKKQPH